MYANPVVTIALAMGLVCGTALAADAPRVTCVNLPPTDAKNAWYVSNREPLAPSPFIKLPIGAIAPQGWLRRTLELEADGMTGRLTEISPWCKAEGNAWLSPKGEGHSPWEEMPYWLKGFGDLGYVLKDERIGKESRRWIEGLLASQREDGWFGPRANLTNADGKSDLWPNMCAVNALQSFFEATGDKRVLEFLTKYFKWQLSVPEQDFITGSWQKRRAGDDLESVYWLYNRTGDGWLLDLARKVHAHTDDWTGGVANWHGVNFAQGFREPAVFWMQARQARFLLATPRHYDTVMGLYGQVPGGMFGADENCRRGFGDPRQGAESCTMVEYMHSFEMLLRITGDPLWADRCEEVAFNSLPCAQTPDQKGLHYLTAPNQPDLDAKNHAPGIENSGCQFAYNPHDYRCCQHNIAMGWPYYAEELWLATPDGGLAAALYAPCAVEAKAGDGTAVRIAEATGYPVAEAVTLTITTPKAVRFPLYLRVPRWCAAAKVAVNGQALPVKAEPLAYLVIERTWESGDKVLLDLPMALAATVWEKNQKSVSVSRGPLWFSLRIGEEWKRYGGTDAWPAMEVHPTSPWNYGLQIDPKDPGASIQVAKVGSEIPSAALPFALDAAPIELKSKARRIPEWGFDRHKLVAVLQPSPVLATETVETVTLIPMGWARLRISAFPVASTSPDAAKWQAPQAAFEASASHCNGGDTTDALCDGLLPKASDDGSIPRFTWWDHKGTTEWVAYKFAKPQTLSWTDVYWFDDTGHGGCRVPASWRILYREGNEWKPVVPNVAQSGTAKDTFNKVTFAPVTTSEVRVEVTLQKGFSGGILEWRVGPVAGK